MDINTLLCNDESKNDNDVEMKDIEGEYEISTSSTDSLPMLSELKPQTTYESTNPILYSTTSSSSNAMVSNTNNEDMPNMKALSINSPTSTPLTPPTPPASVIGSKLDSLSGIAAATAVLRQRKHVRNSPRARKSVLSSGAGSPGGNHYPYTTTVGSSRHRLLAPVTPQPPPSHPISTAILRRNRIHNGIKNVVRGVSDSLFTHNNDRRSNFTCHNIFSNLPFHCNNQNNSMDQSTSTSQTTTAQSTPSTQSSTQSSATPSQQQQPSMPDVNLNQDDVNHGIKCCLQWLKYAISHLDQEINLLRNIANESFHIYCNNIQNRRNNANSNNMDNNNKDNSNIESDYYNSTSHDVESSSSSTSENSNQRSRLLPQFQLCSNQVTNYHRKSLIEIKRDIVFTIRKTVEIIIKGASKYLPDESRIVIRRFILSLPSRLSKLTQRPNVPETIKSSAASTSDTATTATTVDDKNKDANTNVSPTSSVTTEHMNEEKDDHMKSAKEESLKIMTLATEGNDMLKKMMDVFEKSFQENNKNNLNNVNLINTNEGSSLNYNTNKMFYNPIGTNNNNNNKFNKINSNTTNSTANSNTTTNSNYVINDSMNCEESQPVNTN